MLVGETMAAVVFKIPRDLMAQWIGYCHRQGMTQSRMVRYAIGYFIQEDPTSTNEDLVMGARLVDYGYGYDPRGPAEQ